MTNLPEPMTPAECDLRDYPWMPLVIPQLMKSKAWFLCKKTPELAFYMMNLWMTSWNELPAASLEDDDELLCDQAVCDPKRWPKVREQVLRNWVKCSDGRLYHATVAKEAKVSWEKKLSQKSRTEAARKAKAERHGTKPPVAGGNSGTDTVAASVTGSVTEDVTDDVATPATDAVATPATETVTGSTRPDQTVPDQERKKDPSLRSGPDRRKCRLPQDWAPSEAGLRFAAEHGADARQEFPKFRDHHTAKGSVMVDWDAAWRTWCQNARRFGGGKPAPVEGPFSRMVREEREAQRFSQPEFDEGMLLQ